MHKDIVEHVARDRGYNQGLEDGKKIAWDLLGQLSNWYKKEWMELDAGSVKMGSQEEIRVAKSRGRYEAIIFAQMVIKRGKI